MTVSESAKFMKSSLLVHLHMFNETISFFVVHCCLLKESKQRLLCFLVICCQRE